MKVLVAGGTGFIGRAVVQELKDRGDDVVVVSRNPRQEDQVDYQHLPAHADAVINLAGEWVAGIWTPAKKSEIIRSRVDTTRLLVDWMLDSPDRLPVLINSSAVGYYGHRPGEVLTEESPYDPRNAFRGRVCRAWEAEAQRAADMGARVVLARVGGVLDPNGGLIKLFEPLIRIAPFLVPPSADKLLSWISLPDTVSMILFALDNEQIVGPLNVTAPESTTYGVFVSGLGKMCGKKTFGSLPPWLLRMLLWENSEAITDSQDVRPAKALKHGFEFSHPTIESWFASAIPGERACP